MIKKTELKHLIDVAAGRVPADVVIRNAQIVDVFLGTIRRATWPWQLVILLESVSVMKDSRWLIWPGASCCQG